MSGVWSVEDRCQEGKSGFVEVYMDATELNINFQRHICYSEKAKDIVLQRLSKKYPPAEAAQRFEQIQRKYAEYLSDLPYLGGKKCSHNGVGGTYDCIFIFAYYEVLNREPSLDEIYEMNNALFLPPFQRLGKFINLNHSFVQRLLSFIFNIVAKRDKKLLCTTPDGYDMSAEPYDKTIGVRYHFDRCPIAEFAKKHNLTEIMPAFCNGDYLAMDAIQGALIRRHTCANSDVCDYLIVGNQSDIAKEHPQKTDEHGYWYND
jgi:hypothetical protein